LATLGAEARRVIEFYDFERLPARVVGLRLGIGERTARSRVRRATERLRSAMREEPRRSWVAVAEKPAQSFGSSIPPHATAPAEIAPAHAR
jgi:hypothetical protein